MVYFQNNTCLKTFIGLSLLVFYITVSVKEIYLVEIEIQLNLYFQKNVKYISLYMSFY